MDVESGSHNERALLPSGGNNLGPTGALSTVAELDEAFRTLVHDVIGNYDPDCGLGHMTTAVYDTAWVACIKAPDGSQLFPAAFEAVLKAQDDKGAWSNEEDLPSRILSSLAGLFALLICRGTWKIPQLDGRVESAKAQLELWLKDLDNVKAGGVGFEVIAPCLLNLLAKEGVSLDFPAKDKLLELQRAKLAKIPRDMLYNTSTPLLHSLEAFFDDADIDYDRFAKHKVGGSLMASPSSTAAYLMRSSHWDDEAEAYLRRAMEHGAGKGSGAFPSAFPSTVFETTWVLSTTLSAGYGFSIVADACKQNLQKLHSVSGAADGKCVAFTPSLEPDLDDTARMSITASFTGLSGIAHSMITKFENGSHMETYKLEREPSFSANCNALMALLVEPLDTLETYRSTIEKVTRFLCNTWAVTSSLPADKWNISPHYAPMLMAETFVKLTEQFNKSDKPIVSAEIVRVDAFRALVQYTMRTLHAQNANGSWGARGPREETAYAIIGLASASRIPELLPLSDVINKAIQTGCEYLQAAGVDQEPEHLWVEKVLYGSKVLSKAYVLAALRMGLDIRAKQPSTESKATNGTSKGSKTLKLLQMLPLLKGCPAWIITGSAIEAQTFLPSLQRIRDRVFTREGFSDDKYFDWIPVIWTVANNSLGGCIASTTMQDMMAISVINFQVDEFMEYTVASELTEYSALVTSWIAAEAQAGMKEQVNGFLSTQMNDAHSNDAGAKDADSDLPPRFTAPLSAFFQYIRANPRVQSASQHDRDKLFAEIPEFFNAHMTQNFDNLRVVEQHKGNKRRKLDDSSPLSPETYQPAQRDFYSWVRGTAANHTSCPYSFAYAACLSGRDGKDFFPTLQQKYIAEDVCRHLATMCRLYNDAGSMRRDQEELNLNSANFEGHHAGVSESLSAGQQFALLRDRVLAFASYERSMLDTAYKELEKISDRNVVDLLRIFIRVTDMFGEIYILKDLASRKIEQ